MSRAIAVGKTGAVTALIANIKTNVNGVLEHELSVGDVGYVKNENKLVCPFVPDHQYGICLAHKVSVANSKLLVVARMGLDAYWGDLLTASDVDETITEAQLKETYATVEKDGTFTITPKNGGKSGNVQVIPNSPVNIPGIDWTIDWTALMDQEFAPGIHYRNVFLHMKDVGMLVAANLVRTGHHYQKLANGSFKAMERKRWGKDTFDDEARGILYHEAMHPYTQATKLTIYTNWLAKFTANTLDGTYLKLDTVVTKRLPVVPAGAAWLSAGLTVMAELKAIPSIGTKIPIEYDVLINEGLAALAKVKHEGKVRLEDIVRFEAVAAFAYGLLTIVAPTHSAVGAPSLKKKADEHLGAAAAGSDLARAAMRA